MKSVRELEIDWYRVNGRYPNHRIKVSQFGEVYVMSDFSWNTGMKEKYNEYIEEKMKRDGVYNGCVELKNAMEVDGAT